MPYLVAIELSRLEKGDIPRTCVMTGTRDDVDLVEVRLSASGFTGFGFSLLHMSPTVKTETVSTRLALPLCTAAARRLAIARAARMLLLITLGAAALAFYVGFAGDILIRTNRAWEWGAVLVGPVVPFLMVVAAYDVIVRPRVEPLLSDAYQSWVKLLIPSEQAAIDIDRWMAQKP